MHTFLILTGMTGAAVACVSRTILTDRSFSSGDWSHFFI